jgi:exopolysaccharide biosynthesis polyprenyl glycosylphosphotransferase
VSLVSVHPGESADAVQPTIEVAEFARLIPGEIAAIRNGVRKPAAAVKKLGQGRPRTVTEISGAAGRESKLAFLLPSPMRSRNAWNWVRSVSADLALVMLNWLLIGALLVPMRMVFPHRRVFSYAAGAPFFLLGVALLHGAFITLIGYASGLYTNFGGLREQRRVLGNSVLWSTALLAVASVLQGNPLTRAGLFLVAGALHLATLYGWRRSLFHRCRADVRTENTRNVLIVGAGAAGQRVASQLRRFSGTAKNVCGFLDDEKPLEEGVIGRVSDLACVARRAFIDEVILAAPGDRNLAQEIVREARRLRLDVEIVPELFGCKPADPAMERVGDLPLICLHAERLPGAALAIKRLFDVLAAAFGLLVASPLFAIIAVLIKADSPGTILYRAQRAGRKGLPFPCFKFRTMVSNAEALKGGLRGNNQRSGPFFKITGDPRITRVGRFLRRYSLDELPQLWNVLRGEMSLVGPRPHPLDDFAGYHTRHLARLDMTPGITGLWQVTARRDPSFQRGMELDREYIQRWNLGLDFQILLKTIFAVLQGGGE